jgi:hypothetical protein
MSEIKKGECCCTNTIWGEFNPIPFIETLPTEESIITIQMNVVWDLSYYSLTIVPEHSI